MISQTIRETNQSLREFRDRAMDHAVKAAYNYACNCELGFEREKAFEIYENLRTANRVY